MVKTKNKLGIITIGIYRMENGGGAEITKVNCHGVFGNISGFPACQHVWNPDGSLSGLPECRLIERIRDLNQKPKLAHPKYIKLTSKEDQEKLVADMRKKRKAIEENNKIGDS